MVVVVVVAVVVVVVLVVVVVSGTVVVASGSVVVVVSDSPVVVVSAPMDVVVASGASPDVSLSPKIAANTMRAKNAPPPISSTFCHVGRRDHQLPPDCHLSAAPSAMSDAVTTNCHRTVLRQS